MNGNVSAKKIAMVIAFNGFKDSEYLLPKSIFKKAGHAVLTTSNQTGQARGSEGAKTDVDTPIDNLNVNTLDAIVFIGGSGCLDNLDNQNSYHLAREACQHGKILAAICIAPVILAKSGVLKEKKATVWSSPDNQSPVEILKNNKVIYTDETIVTDGNIITANGAEAATEFAHTILDFFTRGGDNFGQID